MNVFFEHVTFSDDLVFIVANFVAHSDKITVHIRPENCMFMKMSLTFTCCI